MAFFSKGDLAQAHALLKKQDPAHAAAAAIMYETASRPSEVLGNNRFGFEGLTWARVGLSGPKGTGSVRLEVAKRRGGDPPRARPKKLSIWQRLKGFFFSAPAQPTAGRKHKHWKNGKVSRSTTTALRALRKSAARAGKAKATDRVFAFRPGAHWKQCKAVAKKLKLRNSRSGPASGFTARANRRSCASHLSQAGWNTTQIKAVTAHKKAAYVEPDIVEVPAGRGALRALRRR
jgi:integrase